MKAAVALITRLIEGQERILKRLDRLEAQIDRKLYKERVRVETIARRLENAPEPQGMTAIKGGRS